MTLVLGQGLEMIAKSIRYSSLPLRGVVQVCVALTVFFSTFVFAQAPVLKQNRSRTPPDVSAFIPADAVLNKKLTVDLENDGVDETVLAYAVPDKSNPYRFGIWLRILKYQAPLGWSVAFEENPDGMDTGAQPNTLITIEKVMGTNGKAGVVVVLHYSGAGTASAWHVLVAVRNRIVKLEATGIKTKVLKDRGYWDGGYNGVSTEGDLIIEYVPGYSENTARCCPDRPPLEIRVKFLGTSLSLESVREVLPFTPQKH
jgi:hypothetical protein